MTDPCPISAAKSMQDLKMEDTDDLDKCLSAGLTSEMRNAAVEDLIEKEVDKITQKNLTSNRLPELIMLVPCSVNEHLPKEGGCGFFVIRGNKLMDISRAQLGQKAESILSSAQGCGYENCRNTALESLKDDSTLPDMICCSVKMPTHMVSLTDFCEEHEDTNFSVLVVSNLLDATSQFKKLSMTVINKGCYRIPFAENEIFSPDSAAPKAPVFALSVSSVLKWANLINNKQELLQVEFRSMPFKLRSTLKELHSLILDRFSEVNLKVDQEIEYLNKITDIKKKNERMRGQKRKNEEHVVDLVKAKKHKSLEINWFTKNMNQYKDDANAEIEPAFTDMTLKCELYEITLSQDKGYGNYQDVESIKTMATKSWDRTFNCLSCQTSHKVIDSDNGLNLVVSDQHFPAVIPCHRNSCIAVARYGNLTLQNLYRHVLYPILKGEGSGVSTDRNGATDIIQYCISRGIRVTLMMCSGTSLIRDGPAGYTHAMQEILFLTNDKVFHDKDRNSFIRSVIFSAPLIPAVIPASEHDSDAIKLSKYKMEATNMGRIACLRSSDLKFQFISSTEFVQNSMDSEDKSSLRQAIDYSFLGGLKAYPNKMVLKDTKVLKLPTIVTLPKASRSNEEGILKLGVLAEYAKAVHIDFNQVNNTTLAMPTSKDMLIARLCQPNILMDTKSNFESFLSDCPYFENPIIACVNPGKHATIMMFKEVNDLEAHVKSCFNFREKLGLTVQKKAKKVFYKVELSNAM